MAEKAGGKGEDRTWAQAEFCGLSYSIARLAL